MSWFLSVRGRVYLYQDPYIERIIAVNNINNRDLCWILVVASFRCCDLVCTRTVQGCNVAIRRVNCSWLLVPRIRSHISLCHESTRLDAHKGLMYDTVYDWLSAWGTRTPGGTPSLRENILIKTKHNCMNREPGLIVALMKIRPRIEVLACQKQAQSSH
jgi:hypothetical protein